MFSYCLLAHLFLWMVTVSEETGSQKGSSQKEPLTCTRALSFFQISI